ncbi:hypothetical protein GCM10011371_00030 [Novosphingobium marinum]|uniref:hypothetical protein n=1 Tax=Novosphingobium marinum TaxID=1514948 RepID=UPI0019C4BA60|nr:hypothetical protein [Novosphingobium marinum]GGC16607.1 hypothetical protein GCM10011371_00030 [Novosphingobium marinum]
MTERSDDDGTPDQGSGDAPGTPTSGGSGDDDGTPDQGSGDAPGTPTSGGSGDDDGTPDQGSGDATRTGVRLRLTDLFDDDGTPDQGSGDFAGLLVPHSGADADKGEMWVDQEAGGLQSSTYDATSIDLAAATSFATMG